MTVRASAPCRSLSAMDDRLLLRPVTEDDLPVLEALTNDPDSTGPYAWFGWRTPGSWRRRWAEDGLLTDDGGTFIVVRGAGQLGFVVWRKVQTTPISYCWNIGIGLLPQARGHGHGTEAQRLLASYLFTHSLANRIEADTEIDNIAECRALENAGFTREGVLRGIGFRDGQWRDGVIFSVLRHEMQSG